MIIDTYTEKRENYEADICIIGAGAAGITIAKELSDTNLDVIILETGGYEIEDDVNTLSEGTVDYSDGGLSYVMTGTRIMALGGTTNVWGGMSAPFTEMEMQERDWVPHSAWPIKRKDLDPYYIRAHKLLELGEYDYDVKKHIKEYNKTVIPFDSSGSIEHKLFRFSGASDIPPDKRLKYGPLRFKREALKLKNKKNIIFLLHAHCTHFHSDESNQYIHSADITNFKGWKGNVKARVFVLAAGAMNNVKILLNTEKDGRPAIGNTNDQVGRYFMEHPHITCGFIFSTKETKWATGYKRYGSPEGKKSVTFWPTVGPTDKAQRKYKIANFSASLEPLSGEKREENSFPASANYDFFKKLDYSSATGTSSLTPDNAQTATIYCRMEQSPNPESRIYLKDEKDQLGLKQIALHWKMTDLDMRTAKVSTRLIAEEIGRLSYGRVRLAEWQYDNRPWNKVPPLWGCHHMGTTRMGENKKTSVVDANCKIHSVDNMYVAGSSIFTTSGYANPTLNLVVLAMRLADHLKIKFNV